MDPENFDRNDMTVAVLRVVKFMLQHGFYQSSKELMSVAKPVISILSGLVVKKKNKDEAEGELDPEMEAAIARKRYFPDSHTDPAIVSKCLACDILLMIGNLEKDSRCTVYLAKLRRDIDLATINGSSETVSSQEDLNLLNIFAELKGYESIDETHYLI